jgi:thiol-disulfide isomerase/thioredoxin
LVLVKNLVIQITIFFVIFQLLTWFKESSMLDTHQNLNGLNFNVPTITGDVISLTPNKKTVIYFFAPWCSICHASIDNLQALYEKNETVNVIAVALDYVDVNEIESFVSQHQLTFPIAIGNESVKQAYKVPGYPSYYVVDEDNTVIAKSIGYSTEIGLYFRSF